MKTALLLLIAILTASAVSAQPTHNLYWDDCSVGGTRVKWFACDTNAGSQTLVSSFTAPAGINQWTGNEVEIWIRTMTAVPDWWRLRNQTGQTNQCRNGAISVSADFSGGPFSCLDPYTTTPLSGIATYLVAPGGDVYRARLLLVGVVAAGQEHPLIEGAEYYSAKIIVSNLKTTGTGACAGCATPAIATLVSTKVVQPAGAPGGDVAIVTPGSNVNANWQGDCYVTTDFPGQYTWHCTTPTHSPSWGAVKALYR